MVSDYSKVGYFYPESILIDEARFYFVIENQEIKYIKTTENIPQQIFKNGELIAKRAKSGQGKLYPLKIKTRDETAKLKLVDFDSINRPIYKEYKILNKLNNKYYPVEKISRNIFGKKTIKRLEYFNNEETDTRAMCSGKKIPLIFCASFSLTNGNINYVSEQPKKDDDVITNRPSEITNNIVNNNITKFVNSDNSLPSSSSEYNRREGINRVLGRISKGLSKNNTSKNTPDSSHLNNNPFNNLTL
jgi:hypothetical protein